jgi:peroxiredoxin
MPDQKAKVTIGTSIQVDPDRLRVKKNQEKAKWENYEGTPFAIVLPPGYETPQCGPEGSKYVCVSKEFTAVGIVKYTVTSAGKPDLDPDIEVVP